jgi:hypothetical protein
MPNYQNGKIYSIRSRSCADLVYVGSTTQSLSKRFGKHKTASNPTSSKQIINIGDAYIELIEEYACDNKMQLERREGQIMRTMDCVNTRIEGRTDAEYRQDNQESIRSKMKQYRQDNKEYIASRNKQYNQANKEEIAAKGKQYEQDCKERETRTCICGVSYNYGKSSSRKRHYSSQTHVRHVHLIYDRLAGKGFWKK